MSPYHLREWHLIYYVDFTVNNSNGMNDDDQEVETFL